MYAGRLAVLQHLVHGAANLSKGSPSPKKPRRPEAKELAGGKYRQRVVTPKKGKGAYTRKKKPKKGGV